jgi:hypothetical protein
MRNRKTKIQLLALVAALCGFRSQLWAQLLYRHHSTFNGAAMTIEEYSLLILTSPLKMRTKALYDWLAPVPLGRFAEQTN